MIEMLNHDENWEKIFPSIWYSLILNYRLQNMNMTNSVDAFA